MNASTYAKLLFASINLSIAIYCASERRWKLSGVNAGMCLWAFELFLAELIGEAK
jgi:hypothetical protein